MADQKVITRLPPSPTGPFHLGTARTALYNYLYAKKQGGKIVLRFEDTDKARSKKEFEDDIFEGVTWLGLSFDGIYKQSERTAVYKRHLEKMLADGSAYISDESAVVSDDGEEDEGEEEGNPEKPERRSHVIRLKNPGKEVTFVDTVLGEITVDTKELGDLVIAKSLEEPLYHLAVVVDDFEMGVTHVIRGADGIYNTPRQILIQEAIGAPRPSYTHIPFVLGADKAKLSKRNGSAPVSTFRAEGYLPEALLNYLALLGWHPADDREIFTLPELIEAFDLDRVQKAGAVFDVEKLKWVNREHLKKLSDAEFMKGALAYLTGEIMSLPQWSEERFARLVPNLRERVAVYGELSTLHEAGDLAYFFDTPVYEPALLVPGPKKNAPAPEKNTVLSHLKKTQALLAGISEEEFSAEMVKSKLMPYAEEKGRGEVLWPARVALSGRERSPDPFTLAAVIGRTEALARLKSAERTLSELST